MPDLDRQPVAPPLPACQPGCRGFCRVLVVDDSPTVRGIIRRALAGHCGSCRMGEAGGGKEALHEMARERFDLIILDLQMPGMGGESLLKSVTRLLPLQRKKILVFSSAISQELRDSFRAHANVGFLGKPASPEDLGRAVSDLLAGHES